MNQTPLDPYRVVVAYNAWEDDSGEKPIVPALLKLAQELDQIVVRDDGPSGDVSSFFDATIECLGFIPGWGEYVDRFQGVKGHLRKLFRNKSKEKASSNDIFKRAKGWSDLYKRLGDLMDSTSASHYKVVLVIDDLDRVLPTRQIDLLESLYHLSQSMRILVLVAYDSSQLDRSVANFFGENVTASDYTQKMFSCTLHYERPETNDLLAELSETMRLKHPSQKFLDEYDLMTLFSGFSISNRDFKKLNLAIKTLLATKDFRMSFGMEYEISLILSTIKYLNFLPPSPDVRTTLDENVDDIIMNHSSRASYYDDRTKRMKKVIFDAYEKGPSEERLAVLRVCTFDDLDSHIRIERPEEKVQTTNISLETR